MYVLITIAEKKSNWNNISKFEKDTTFFEHSSFDSKNNININNNVENQKKKKFEKILPDTNIT